MIRENWKTLIEIVGILSIVVTMAFVALEIRQNTEAVRSTAIQDISRWSYDATVLMVESPDLMEARYIPCISDLSERQYQLLRTFYAALIRVQVNRYYQMQLGIISEEMALSLGGKGGAYRGAFFAEIWPDLKIDFDQGFQDYIEREVLPLSEEAC